ncbi:MAG: hypothetical protein GY950_10515 [bacterium]|nr:hypothetical protein [bacterium]
MALFKVDDLFSYRDANDIKKLWAGADPPAGPGDGEVWLDTGASPGRLKRYVETTGVWETITAVRSGTAAPAPDPDPGDSMEGELFLDTSTSPPQLKCYNSGAWVTVTGESYLRDDQDDTFTGALTSTKTSGAVFKFDNGHSIIAVDHGAGLLKINSGVDENDLTYVNDGGSQIRMAESGGITIAVSTAALGTPFSDLNSIKVDGTGIIFQGTVYAQQQLILPQSEPGSPGEGSLWMV